MNFLVPVVYEGCKLMNLISAAYLCIMIKGYYLESLAFI